MILHGIQEAKVITTLQNFRVMASAFVCFKTKKDSYYWQLSKRENMVLYYR